MASLKLNFLGDLEVVRDGQPLPLPPSKKTRALLAYLALNGRDFRREHLCELLWELPDDPKGSLRWSLSKLRRLVDDDARRIVADRSHVRFEPHGASIDVAELRHLADTALASSTIEALEAAAKRYRGNFLEGLDLPNFHDFHAWCAAERELAARAQAAVLSTLVDRLGPEPARALPHARALVTIDPYDEWARATLIRLLSAVGHADEAEQHFQLGMRLLNEIGAPPSAALIDARRASDGKSSLVTAPKATAAVAPLPRVDGLIGRDAEAADLCADFARVLARGQPQVTLLFGRPGIGKSTLLSALEEPAHAAGAIVLRASAVESETIRPFAVWIDALRRFDAKTATDVFRSESEDTRDRLFARLSKLLALQAEQRPVLILVDDLQWCDESSAAAMHYALRMNPQLPVFIALTARDDELRDNSAVQQALRGLRHDGLLKEVALGPLSNESVERLITAYAPNADARALTGACGGNPLIAIELARAITFGERGSSLDELVLERVSRCDAGTADLIRWAAVLSPRIDAAFLARVTELDVARIEHALDIAERQALMQLTEEGFRFSHTLIARYIYGDISPVRRRVMHRRVAELLERETALDLQTAADLAHHAQQSGEPDLAARAMICAGRLCLRFFANDDAQSLAHQGLAFAARLDDAARVRVTLELKDILMLAAPVPDWQSEASTLVELAEQALDHGAPSHARLGYHMASYLRWAHGDWARAREATLQAARATRAGADEDQVVGMAEAAKCLAMLERDLSVADAMLLEARSLASRKHVATAAIPAGLGMLRFHEGALDEAEALFDEARLLCKSAGDRLNEFQANEYLVMIDVERENYDAAKRRARALVELGAKLRDGSEAPFAEAVAAMCEYAVDDDPAALDDAIDALRTADAKHRLAYVLTRTALLDLARGRPSDAMARAGEALGYAEILERPTEQLLAHVVLAQASRASERKRHLDAIAVLDDQPVAVWARARAAALATPAPQRSRK